MVRSGPAPDEEAQPVSSVLVLLRLSRTNLNTVLCAMCGPPWVTLLAAPLLMTGMANFPMFEMLAHPPLSGLHSWVRLRQSRV